MATADPFTDLVSCPICYETFTDAKILKCLHTFCGNCIKSLRRNRSSVECPQCRTKSYTRDIKKDFNKMSLVEAYNRQKSEANSGSLSSHVEIHPCESCRKSDRLGMWFCIQCEMYFCNDCEEAHRNIPALSSSHELIAISGQNSEQTTQIMDSVRENSRPSMPSKVRNFLKLTYGEFKEVNRGTLDGNKPWRLYIIGDVLWCTCEDGLYLYDKSTCKIVHAVHHNTIKDAKGITQDHAGNIIVACANDNGLLHLDYDGKFRCYISDGSFSDVCLHNQRLYAYEYLHSKILVFYYVNDRWFKKSMIQIQRGEGRDADAIYVTDDHIYMTSYNQALLLIYSHGGALLAKHSIMGTGDNIGELWGPTLCDVDNYGNVIIADCWKRKNFLQICKNNGDWTSIEEENKELNRMTYGSEPSLWQKFSFQVSHTMKAGVAHAVVDDDCDNIWILRSHMLVWEVVMLERACKD